MAKPAPECPQGTIFLNANHRKQARASVISMLEINPFIPRPTHYADDIQLVLVPRKQTPFDTVDSDVLFKEALSQLKNRPMYDQQPYIFEFQQQTFDVSPKNLPEFKIVNEATNFIFGIPHPQCKTLAITGTHVEAAIMKESELMKILRQMRKKMEKGDDVDGEVADTLDIDIEFLGVGGCNKQFADIFRRAFVPRLLPASLVRAYNMQMVRGMILYGPPGTGKTLIARKIGELLNAKEPKLVSGPEILNAYVGKSEENIRELFKDAEKEFEEKGEDSELHLIIMDELDAICKQRGSRNDSTGTHDSIVNQLLAKMDGVKQINNVLVIGMTNRLDLMDEALLRPGRFEIQVEINLPDKQGREAIFRIHTRRFKDKGSLQQDVDIHELAELTPNYSGAEILGVTNAALSYAQTRMLNEQTQQEGKQVALSEFKLFRKDFLKALKEVKAQFGKVDEKVLETVQQMGFVKAVGFHEHLQDIMNYIETIRNSTIRMGTILLHSDVSGTGKSSIAAEIARMSKIEFVKFVSADSLVLRSATEMERCNTIVRAFQDAYKVPEALIILDGIEDIIMYTSEGIRFSNQILTTLLPLLKRGQGRLIVVGTTSKYFGMGTLDVTRCFYKQIQVGGVEKSSLQNVVNEWCQTRGVKWTGGDVRELESIKQREVVTIRAFLQGLEQAASGKSEIGLSEFNKYFETTW